MGGPYYFTLDVRQPRNRALGLVTVKTRAGGDLTEVQSKPASNQFDVILPQNAGQVVEVQITPADALLAPCTGKIKRKPGMPDDSVIEVVSGDDFRVEAKILKETSPLGEAAFTVVVELRTKAWVAASAVARWAAIVPDATAGTAPAQRSQDGATRAQGPLTKFALGSDKQPSMTYVAGVVAAPLDPSATAAAVDAAVDGIRAARAQIRARYLVLRNNASALGFEASPNLDSRAGVPDGLVTAGSRQGQAFQKADASFQDIVDASLEYVKWFRSATTKPTDVSDPKDIVWRAFRRMCDWEGMPSAVNTWDRMNVTFGAGFAASAGGLQTPGQAQELVAELCARSPAAKSLLADAGLAMDGTDFVVVDTAQKWKLRGMDAELYLRTRGDLISLYINVAQGVFVDGSAQKTPKDELRQAALDANFFVFVKHAARGVSAAQLGTDTDLAALKLHCAHSGSFSFGAVAGFGSVPDLVRFVYSRVSSRPVADSIVPIEWRGLAPPP